MWRLYCKNSARTWAFYYWSRKCNTLSSYCNNLKKLSFGHPEHCRTIIAISKTRVLHPRHDKDNVPRDFTLVYENSLSRIIGPGRVLATTSCIISVGLSVGYLVNFAETLEPWNVFALSGMCLFFMFMTAFVNVMFRYYLLRIYFSENAKTFVGIYHTFFGKVKQIRYDLTDLKSSYKPGAYKAHEKCNVHIQGRRFHLRGGDFVLPKYYNMHLGLE